ncbi:carboxylesterase family protein, partial [Salmonella sp. s54395]|uniref:carboxylesterase family protein n=1 Tax=Salmonella sp. s54395 TaxID=3159664 RepID=UPI003980646E
EYYHYIFDAAFSFEHQWTDDFDMCWGHVCHGGDLAYIFRSASLGGEEYTEEESVLIDHMSAYISNFLHTGNPNTPGTEALKQKHAGLPGRRPHWPRMTEKPNNYYSMYYANCGGSVDNY